MVAEPLIWHGKNGEPSGDKEPDYRDRPMAFRPCMVGRKPIRPYVDEFIRFAKEHSQYTSSLQR